jgi:putative ABC transport system permease protein
MLKSYFLLAWRNLLKHKTSSIINISGLALGLATSILVMLFLVDEFSYDQFHKNISHLYLVMRNQQLANGIVTRETTAGPMGKALEAGMPVVVHSSRQVGMWGMARVGDKQFSVNGIYADPAFFQMMTFPAVEGDPVSALKDPAEVVLTESEAKKLFGTGPAIGKVFVIQDTVAAKVGAVVRDVPRTSTIQFDCVLPFGAFERQNDWLQKWDNNQILTYVELLPSVDVAAFERQATTLLQTRSNDSTVSQFLMPMAKMHLHSGFYNGKQSGGRIYIVVLIVILGLFVLAIACINFMNIATARSEVRAREVGIRKVMGATRQVVMLQFFCEAITIVFLSLGAGLLLSQMVIPAFNRYMNVNIELILTDWRVWVGMLAIGLLTGVLAGSYPAVFLSRFVPSKVLKGRVFSDKRGTLLRRALVTVQFWVAIFFIVGTVVVWQEINYVRSRPIGYEQENLIDVHSSAELGAKYSLFEQEMSTIPGVRSVSAGSDNLVNFNSGITGMDWPGKIPGHEVSIMTTSVGYNWVRTTGMGLVEGRDFSPAYTTDSGACLVNEVTVSQLGLKKPVLGQKLGGSPIIGVVKNFVYNNPSGIIAPMAIYLYKGAPDKGGHFFVRVRNDAHWRETIARIGEIVKKIDPKHSFDFSFTQEEYQQRFEEFTTYGVLATILGGLAIFISCLGLLGLSAFLAERRSKEMSIRKVFGASVRQVLVLLSLDFLRPVVIAFLLAVPAAAWAANFWLNNIAYHVSLSWTVFVAAAGITLLVALLTVGYNGMRTANENPAANLKNE